MVNEELIGFRCQKECMESKLVTSWSTMHNLIKIHHKLRVESNFTDFLRAVQIDKWTRTASCAHMRLVQDYFNKCFAVDVKGAGIY